MKVWNSRGPWMMAIHRALGPGSLASLLSSAALMLCGWAEHGRGLATHNGPSQWIFGRSAAARRRIDLQHTLAGFLIHHASSLMWATIHQRLRMSRPTTVPRSLAEGLAVAAAACLVDYRMTPKRFEPGFEKHVSRRSLGFFYVIFGVGLGVGHYLMNRPR